MNAKNRTIAVLKYINSIESAKSRYINKTSENIVCTIYYIYKDIIRELSPGHHVLKNVGAIRSHLLIQQDTKYILSEKYRKLITLISFYYYQKNYRFLFLLVEDIIERSKNLFEGKI
jgi:hypothetical protein|nr:MAG TPA: hypothetical protein [Caudoviricetes sp.]